MGLCPSKEQKEDNERNATINKQIWNDRVIDMKTVKLLLLGAGECGKSTVLKQLQIIHADGFSKRELNHWKDIIYSNTVTSMMQLCQAVKEMDIPWQDPLRENDSRIVLDHYANGTLLRSMNDRLFRAIKLLWEDTAIKNCYDRRNEFQLIDSAKYFFENIDRYHDANFLPTNQDVLMCRVATTGVTEVLFMANNNNFRVFDVGGQRTERRKWIHCFDNVQAVIFIIAVNEFDQVLAEDGKTNRLLEATRLYRSIGNSSWFEKSAMVLFLNKVDLFNSKVINGRSIKICFPDYNGPNTYADSIAFLKLKFSSMMKNDKLIYMHETCATDTKQVQTILDSVLDTVIAKNMVKSGVI